MEVKTSDVRGAGTDAAVFLTIQGATASTGPHILEAHSRKCFERDQLDRFTLDNLPDVTPLTQIRVSHDAAGFGAAWHLEYVKITKVPGGECWYFGCGQWVEKAEDSSRPSIVLRVEDPVPQMPKAENEDMRLIHTAMVSKVRPVSRQNSSAFVSFVCRARWCDI